MTDKEYQDTEACRHFLVGARIMRGWHAQIPQGSPFSQSRPCVSYVLELYLLFFVTKYSYSVMFLVICLFLFIFLNAYMYKCMCVYIYGHAIYGYMYGWIWVVVRRQLSGADYLFSAWKPQGWNSSCMAWYHYPLSQLAEFCFWWILWVILLSSQTWTGCLDTPMFVD